VKTQSGKTRFVLRDTDGGEFTTFREEIARAAQGAVGHRARVGFHDEQRGRGSRRRSWLVGDETVSVPPDELFDRLQRFKQRVADDIRTADEDSP
jgi:hypothetical protein